jgi:hypothetical protein
MASGMMMPDLEEISCADDRLTPSIGQLCLDYTLHHHTESFYRQSHVLYLTTAYLKRPA